MVYFRPQHLRLRNDWTAYLQHRASQARNPLLKTFFTASTLSSQTPIGELPLLAMDVETTGLDPQHHGIVSLGLVPFDLQRIHLSDHRYWVLKPQQPLVEKSVTFHGITHEQIARAPDLVSILDELFECLTGRMVVVHYRQIERRFLDAAVKARLDESLLFPMIDTMELEARLHRLTLIAKFRHWLGRPPLSIQLYDSRQRYGLPVYQGHHALTDALATAELFQAQMAWHFSPETPLFRLWQ